ncbi:tenascin-X-like [Oryzias melastigma]|uniref:tenascin-X-like n=1 Tax=Oryzias melastigma TaxID=30732 RepID=UPI00168D56D7|nr:tenascin-X-like [Oryzias melastigma]
MAQCGEACEHYTELNDDWLSEYNINGNSYCNGDYSTEGWYHMFVGQTSAQIPETCVQDSRCDSYTRLQMTQPHPTQYNQTVTRSLCYNTGINCYCYTSYAIKVKLCYEDFYVYKLQRLPGCNTAYCAVPNHSFRAAGQDETSITLRWDKVNNSVSFVLLFNGTETNISAPAADDSVTYTVSSLTAATKYTFTLFSVFENVRSSGIRIDAVTAPPNAEIFNLIEKNDTSVTLQLSKPNYSGYLLEYQFSYPQRIFAASDADGPVIYTVPSLNPASKYTFTLFSVFENARSSGVQLTVTTGSNQSFRVSGQNETSITLQWDTIKNSNVSFILEFNGTEININAPNGDGPIFYTYSSLTAGTKYTFTLFTVFGNIRGNAINITAVTAPQNPQNIRQSAQNESSVTLQWDKVNNVSFVLQLNGTETNITASNVDGPETYTFSSLTAQTKYQVTLFSVFENVRSSGQQLTAVTAPQNAKSFKASTQNETSITLQWDKVNNNVSFVLQFNGTETNIRAPAGDGVVNHTVSSLTARTKYTFTLFSVFENVRSSGVNITAATVGLDMGFRPFGPMTEAEVQRTIEELLQKYGLSPNSLSIKVKPVQP